jgi:hypothetical protein
VVGSKLAETIFFLPYSFFSKKGSPHIPPDGPEFSKIPEMLETPPLRPGASSIFIRNFLIDSVTPELLFEFPALIKSPVDLLEHSVSALFLLPLLLEAANIAAGPITTAEPGPGTATAGLATT